jgi:uncharacterized protein YndB with AHSA1/START domain
MMRALLLILAFSRLAPAGEVQTVEYRADDGSRILRQEVIVDAPLDEVWRVFTTKEGWESFAVPFALVDLRVGGIIETSYDPAAEPGDPANIRNRILSFLPRRMLSIQAVQAPPDFAHADLLPSLHSVIEFERDGNERTRVAISGVGYGNGEGYDELIGFFRHGNAWTFERLARRFEEGPLNWNAAVPQASQDAAGEKKSEHANNQ